MVANDINDEKRDKKQNGSDEKGASRQVANPAADDFATDWFEMVVQVVPVAVQVPVAAG